MKDNQISQVMAVIVEVLTACRLLFLPVNNNADVSFRAVSGLHRI